jgi:ElaB/YqjD/DUF883 family membrane-anchored ribosome-binding protein
MKIEELVRKRPDWPINKLIGELKNTYPSQIWTAKSEIPDEFVQQIDNKSVEYEGTNPQIPGGRLTVQQSTEILISQDAIELAIVDCVREIQIPLMHKLGQVEATEEIASFEQGYNSVLENWKNSKAQKANKLLDKAKERVENLSTDAQSRLAANVQATKQVNAVEEKIKNFPQLF